MQLDTNLLQYLPLWYREILDYQELCLAEGESFENLAQAIHSVADNFFFQEMGEGAIAQWEAVFGITANPETETLEFRRARLLNRISIRPPFSLGFLYQKLDELIGKNQWTVTIDYPNYTLYVESSAKNQEYATEVSYTIGKIKPAHIVFHNTPYTEAPLQVAEAVSLSGAVYHYKLGGWGLGVSPFRSEVDKGVIKMENVPSVQPALLNGVASFVAAYVAKARLNGSVLISMLTRSTNGNVTTITYTVKQSDVPEITLIELLDASNNVLTSSTVYVPVTEEVIMKHKLPITEGGTANAQ